MRKYLKIGNENIFFLNYLIKKKIERMHHEAASIFSLNSFKIQEPVEFKNK